MHGLKATIWLHSSTGKIHVFSLVFDQVFVHVFGDHVSNAVFQELSSFVITFPEREDGSSQERAISVDQDPMFSTLVLPVDIQFLVVFVPHAESSIASPIIEMKRYVFLIFCFAY
ncbi:MAG: hypothetical protein ACFN4U_00470 [Candidatus Absconditicoccaceae bacterium]